MRIGDVFEVPLKNNQKGFFQYIMLDETMLSSDVIRVFKRKVSFETKPELAEVVTGEVHFYAHVILPFGVKMNLWKKIGRVSIEENLEPPFFRASHDYGNPQIKVSLNWYVWQANKPPKEVGKLEGEHVQYNLGPVLAAPEIPEIMMTGKSSYFYPAYE